MSCSTTAAFAIEKACLDSTRSRLHLRVRAGGGAAVPAWLHRLLHAQRFHLIAVDHPDPDQWVFRYACKTATDLDGLVDAFAREGVRVVLDPSPSRRKRSAHAR